MKKTVTVVVYTYKGKNLIESLESLYSNASENIEVNCIVYDQHPLNRQEKLSHFPNLKYEHVFWDHQYTPINYKKKEAALNTSNFFLSMSSDIILKKDWDNELTRFVDSNPDWIVSGQGGTRLIFKDKYMLKNMWDIHTDTFTMSQYFDRNFIFAAAPTIRRVEFPITQKYYGEEEFMSISAIKNSIPIFSCPSDYYEDTKERTLETLMYTPFSTEHMYNNFIEYINNPGDDDIIAVEKFFDFHKIDYKKLKKIPYQIDDVLYDPNTLQIVNIGGERYIDSVKTIY